jgi:pSer/pThr/pTyr-binding forkhead associated (FHA) protein
VFCTRCGQQNPADARFCARCGNELLRPGEPVSPPERSAEQTSTLNISQIGAALEGDGAEEAQDLEAGAAVDALPGGSALLVVKRGPNAGSRFLLDSEVTTAGRHPDSDIFLDDVTVSRRHAEFRRDEQTNGFVVQDVGSLNGTYLNRERIETAELASGDEVQVGKFRLVFLAAARTGEGES